MTATDEFSRETDEHFPNGDLLGTIDADLLMQDLDFMNDLPPLEAFDTILWYVISFLPPSNCAHQRCVSLS